jgi:hypothetical protein
VGQVAPQRSKNMKDKNPHNDSPIKLKGEYFVTLYGPDGVVKDYRQGYNVITTVGKEMLANFIGSAAGGTATFTAKYVAIGSDPTGENAANTDMGTELARQTATVSYISGAIVQVVCTFGTGLGTGDIYEYGIFNSNTGGTLLSRDTESGIAKGANDTLKVIAQITLS